MLWCGLVEARRRRRRCCPGWMSGAGPVRYGLDVPARKVTLDMARPDGAGWRCSRAVPARSCFHWAAGPASLLVHH